MSVCLYFCDLGLLVDQVFLVLNREGSQLRPLLSRALK